MAMLYEKGACFGRMRAFLQEINRHNAAVRHATFGIEKNEINV